MIVNSSWTWCQISVCSGPDFFDVKRMASGLPAALTFESLKSEKDNKHGFALLATKCGSAGIPIDDLVDFFCFATEGVASFPHLRVTGVELHLCYCNRKFKDCKTDAPDDFKQFSLELGMISVEGPIRPDLSELPECHAQKVCSIKLSFSSSSAVAFPSRVGYFAAGCGEDADVPWGTVEAMQTISKNTVAQGDKLQRFDFESNPNAGGEFYLCYCDLRLGCTKPEHFNVALNKIKIYGEDNK